MLVAAVVALAMVCTFNTFLCFAVVARLRAVTAGQAALPGDPFGGPVAGERIGDFATTALDGGPLSTADLDAPTAVLFFAPECTPCQEERAALIARREPLAANTVVFVSGNPEDPLATEFAGGLPTGVRVAFVTDDDPVTRAFGGIRGYPTLLRVERATVTVVGHDLDTVADVHALDRV